MKPVWKISLAATILAGGVWAGTLLNMTAEGASVGAQPGTADDPVVTKSYVDEQIQKALQDGSTTTATAAPGVTASPTTSTSGTGSGQGAADAMEIVDVEPGQTLIASAGAEFIVRAGKAVIYSEDSNGVADLTDGIDLAHGLAAPTNHLLSFPREGRGITVQDGQTLNLVVMVRGGYTLK